MKKDIVSVMKNAIDAVPAFIAILITLTICGILSLNWWMSMTHYGETTGHIQIPDVLKNSLMTILGYYFGSSDLTEKISGSVKKQNISCVASIIAIAITLTACGLVFANWRMSMLYYGKTTGIIIPDIFNHALSAILGFYFGSNGTKQDSAQPIENGDKK